MNYIFTNVGYDYQYPHHTPTIIAEVTLSPSTQKEWRDIHKLINAKTYEEIHQLEKMFNSRPSLPNIKNVYFNPPATVVLWDDGTKTVVKCQNSDTYSKETGLALCMAKKAMGNNSRQFNDIFKKWIPEEKKEEKRNFNYEQLLWRYKKNIDQCCKCGTTLQTWGGNYLGDFFVMDKNGNYYCTKCDNCFPDGSEFIFEPNPEDLVTF